MIKKQKIEKEIVYDDFFGPLPWYIKNLEQNKYEIISIIKHLYITYNCNFINGNALFSKEIIDIINKNLLNHNYVINDFKKQPEETEDHILRALDEIIAIKDNSKNAIDFCYDILNCLMFGYGLTKFNELFDILDTFYKTENNKLSISKLQNLKKYNIFTNLSKTNLLNNEEQELIINDIRNIINTLQKEVKNINFI